MTSNNGQVGFTLVELMVGLAIMFILSSIAFVGFQGGGQTLALERSAHKVAQDIRRAEELALQAESSSICGANPLSGYGVYFSENTPGQYILYANCTGEGPGEGYKLGGGGPDDAPMETIQLEDPVEIQSLIVGIGDDWSVSFFPPDPRVVICGSDPCTGGDNFTAAGAGIILRLKDDPTKTKTITINAKGTVDIN